MLANLETATHPDEIDANNLKLLFLKEFEHSHNVYNTCQVLGITRKLVYFDWQDDIEFKKKFDEIRGVQVRDIEDGFLTEAKQNKKAWVPQIFLLKTWMPEKYGDKYELNQNSTITYNFNGLAENIVKRLQTKEVGASIEIVNENRVEVGKD